MSVRTFLFYFALCESIFIAVFADSLQKACPYSGGKPVDLIDKLYSEEFRDSLSPFNKLFLKAIPSEDFFFKLFDTSFKKGTVKRTFFLNCVYWEDQMGVDCPNDLCKTLAKNVEKAYEYNYTPLDYFITAASTFESSLKQQKDQQNTMDENATYETIKSFLRSISKYLCTPDVEGPVESLFALDDGSMEFFRSIGLTDKNVSVFSATSLGNQFSKFTAKNSIQSCPYSGEKPSNLIDELHSEEFKDSLSPFNQRFLEFIPTDDFFFKLFDISFKNGSIEDTFFLSCVYWEVKMGLDCPIDLCKTMAEKVNIAFECNLSPLDYFIAISSALESALQQEYTLNNTMDEDTINELIVSFLSYIAKYLCSPGVDGPEAALFALDDGSMDFYRSIGTTDQDLVYVAKSFGDEFVNVVQNRMCGGNPNTDSNSNVS